MASLKNNFTLRDYQNFVREVYDLPDDRHFNISEMLANMERFLMRGLKGIRQKDEKKIKINMIISSSWLMSILNQLHIDIEEEIWKRFPYMCSYCASCPCKCKERKVNQRQKIVRNDALKPKSFLGFQKMFEEIYPPSKRTIQDAGIHLAEEMGELSEAVLIYRGLRKQADFNGMKLEAADIVSCFIGVFNSLGASWPKEISLHFHDNCYRCHKAPCVCTFTDVMNFKS
ncbi:hypothetical protein HY415_02575 [Candidatus Kaiserbacteria bacterium]|nr:hypothetical protein [Candidatus Kaiserbacteria bacterium]